MNTFWFEIYYKIWTIWTISFRSEWFQSFSHSWFILPLTNRTIPKNHRIILYSNSAAKLAIIIHMIGMCLRYNNSALAQW